MSAVEYCGIGAMIFCARCLPEWVSAIMTIVFLTAQSILLSRA